jgi:hypothetical protein
MILIHWLRDIIIHFLFRTRFSVAFQRVNSYRDNGHTRTTFSDLGGCGLAVNDRHDNIHHDEIIRAWDGACHQN